MSKLLKAIFVVAPLVAAIYIANKAIEQFEHFQENGAHYMTSFHEIDMVVLALAVVALVVLAVCMAGADFESDEYPVSLDDYLLSVLSGTVGVVLVTLGVYQSDIEMGHALPNHMGNGYRSGDSTLVFVTGAIAILLAIYFLVRNWYAYRSIASATTGQRFSERTAEESSAGATTKQQPAPESANRRCCGDGIGCHSAYSLYDRMAHLSWLEREILRERLMSAYVGPVYGKVADVQLILIGPEFLEPKEDAEDEDDQILVGYVLIVDGELVDHEFVVSSLAELKDEESDKPKGDDEDNEPDKPVSSEPEQQA